MPFLFEGRGRTAVCLSIPCRPVGTSIGRRVAKPDTISPDTGGSLPWKIDGSRLRTSPGRPASRPNWKRSLCASPESTPVGDMTASSVPWPISGHTVSDPTVGTHPASIRIVCKRLLNRRHSASRSIASGTDMIFNSDHEERNDLPDHVDHRHPDLSDRGSFWPAESAGPPARVRQTQSPASSPARSRRHRRPILPRKSARAKCGSAPNADSATARMPRAENRVRT